MDTYSHLPEIPSHRLIKAPKRAKLYSTYKVYTLHENHAVWASMSMSWAKKKPCGYHKVLLHFLALTSEV